MERTGGELVQDFLKTFEVPYVFGNPKKFNDPEVDVRKVAEGLGARTQKISNLGAIGDALTQALAYSGPSFLVIDREP